MVTEYPSASKAFNSTIQAFKNNPLLFTPFLIFAVFESLALLFLYLIPRYPLINIFGPIIRTFWGDRFLHYPFNFFLLPKLAANSRMVLSVLLGSLFSGMAVAIVWNLYNQKAIKLAYSLRLSIKKYLSLFTIVLILTATYYCLLKFLNIVLAKYFIARHSRLLFLPSRLWLGTILICLNFILDIIIQSAFTYAIPIVMAENEKTIKAIGKSLFRFKRFFVPTLILVGVPMLFYIPIIVLNSNIPFLIMRLSPESVLGVAFLSIIIGSLIIDAVITIATTFFYLENKK